MKPEQVVIEEKYGSGTYARIRHQPRDLIWSCVLIGFAFVGVGAVLLLSGGGIDLIIERSHVFLPAFCLGTISRLLIDPDSRTVTIDQDGIKVVRTGKTQNFPAHDVDRILIFQKKERVFAVKVIWRSRWRRSLVSGGRLAPESADIGELSRTYLTERK